VPGEIRLPNVAGERKKRPGKKKCQAERLADYEANVILLHERAIVCQVIICVEENNPRLRGDSGCVFG
jgi:hypothetical protein